jgi:type I restriction enzyme M protein
MAVDHLEKTLFAAADKMRGSVPVSDYQYVALGLIFLMYISEAFEIKHAELEADEYADPEDKDEYAAENIFWVPPEARWSYLAANAHSPVIGKLIDTAMRLIEEENRETLEGVLPTIFSNPTIPQEVLSRLIDQFTNDIKFQGDTRDFDLMGRIYEYFLGEFAGSQGKGGGEFYTPASIVRTLVEMLEPTEGDAYDPCCGSGGMFVQSGKFLKEHQGRIGDLKIYGQERTHNTWRLARMNLAIRGMEAKIHWNPEGTLLKDGFPDNRFDFILANPPFNVSDWSGEKLRDDSRWQFGVPPVGNANFAWVQHIVHHLGPNGFAGVVLANGSMSSTTSGEGDIRKALIEGRRGLGLSGNAESDIDGGVVDCMVALPGQMFFGTQIPACLWILSKDRSNGKACSHQLRDRRHEILFINARKMGSLETKTFRSFSGEEIARIAQTYHAWRGEPGLGEYRDMPGFCRSVSIEEVKDAGYALTPGRYVGSDDSDDNSVPFPETFAKLRLNLEEQFSRSKKLEDAIRADLGMDKAHEHE